MINRWQDALTGATVVVFSIGVWLLAGNYAQSAALFPKAVAVVMMMAGAGLTVRGILAPVAGDAIDWAAASKLGIIVVLTILYVIAIANFGYMTASAVFIPVTAWLLGVRRPGVLALATTLFLIIVSWLFVGVFQVPLPRDIILNVFSGS